MKLIDRLTQQSLQAEELLHLDAIVPERYEFSGYQPDQL